MKSKAPDPDIVVRDARASDIEDLAALSAAIFAASFSHFQSPENLSQFLEEKHSSVYYQEVFEDPDAILWVVETDLNLAGYCLLRPNTLPCDPPWPTALEMSRIYIDASLQGRGVGADILQRAIGFGKAQGFSGLVLGVFSENYGAQRFYKRHGFTKRGEFDFPIGGQIDRDYLYGLTFTSETDDG